MSMIYNLGIWLYGLGIHVAAWFLPKARFWVNGRKNLLSEFHPDHSEGKKRVWIHCASLGEFEQARPFIEKIKAESNSFVLLTFFSPSGFEIRKNYPLADVVMYMPLDTPKNAKKWISTIRPDVAFFIKYEFWVNHLLELKKANVPAFLISGLFRPHQPFFKWYGSFFCDALQAFRHFYLQDHASAELLQSRGFKNYTVCGDTRFDRVIQIAGQRQDLPMIASFKQNKNLVVCGSTWPIDEEFLVKIISHSPRQIKWVFAPHQIHQESIQRLAEKSPFKSVLYSAQPDSQTLEGATLLIVDSIGLLSSIYSYADWAYVGGGFGKAVHNTAEPAVYGIPVIIGPQYRKFKEAVDLVRLGAAIACENEQELNSAFDLLIHNPEARKMAGIKAKDYITENSGGVLVIWNQTKEFLDLK